MTETSSCFAPHCGYVAEGSIATCPNCGGRMRNARQVRVNGWMLLVVGLLLSAMMAMILPTIFGEVIAPAPGLSSGQSDTLLLILIGVTVFAVGIAVMGGFQIATGRRNHKLALLFVAIAIASVLLAKALGRTL